MKKIAIVAIGLTALAISACAPRYYDRYDRYGYYGPRDGYAYCLSRPATATACRTAMTATGTMTACRTMPTAARATRIAIERRSFEES